MPVTTQKEYKVGPNDGVVSVVVKKYLPISLDEQLPIMGGGGLVTKSSPSEIKKNNCVFHYNSFL